MAEGLSARQTQILKALIDEYIANAAPVGSEALDKKYNLGISPATIRNEMTVLTKSGYLRQPHTSAGRLPTQQAMRFYIDQLMEEKQMSLTNEVKAKEKIKEAGHDLDKILTEAVRSLSEETRSLALAATDEGKVWRAGYANVFLNPEFADLEICSGLFSFLEETSRIQELFFGKDFWGSPISVLFGEELNWPEVHPVGIVAAHFKVKDHQGALGVVGPTRLSYPTVIPALRYFSGIIEGALEE